MSDDRYSLAEARAIIDAEKCERSGAFGDWCIQHDSYLPSDWATCTHHPGEVADVAAQLLATVERVLALAEGRTLYIDGIAARLSTAACHAVVRAISGEEVTE